MTVIVIALIKYSSASRNVGGIVHNYLKLLKKVTVELSYNDLG